MPLYTGDAVELFVGENPGTGANISGAATTYSKRMDALEGSRGSFQLIWTGTLSGTISVQSTNLGDAATDSDTGWVTETGIIVPAQPSGSASSTMVHYFECGARWTRIKYVNGSGAGTLRAVGLVKR